jgi:SNF family Na+-dependent transporter
MTTEHAKERWMSRLGVILAVAGSAVGLGNFLRFPGQAVDNGGGAFMIPYFCALVLLGIPIGWVEWTLGRHGGQRGFHSAPGILGTLGGRPARYLGTLGLLVPIVIYMYYALIESWCLRYAWGYLTGSVDLGSDPKMFAERSQAFFAQYSGVSGDGSLFEPGGLVGVFFWFIVLVMNLWLVYRGLSRGIELFCRWAMPAMAIFAVIVLVRVLTLGTPDPDHPERSVIQGLGYMWNPRLDKLFEFKTWLAAAGQIFFSLSVGFGVIINYASYLRRRDDVVLSSLSAGATNELFEVGFGGLITITAAFVFLGASGATGGTFGLGFNTLPVVFAHMGAAGRWVGAVWFFMLFLAAITSSLSMLQPAKAFLIEALGISAKRAVVMLATVVVVGSFWVMYFSKDLIALDTMDFWVGTVAIFLFATVELVIFGWIWGIDRGLEEAHVGAEIRIPAPFRVILKYVAPAYLIVVFVGFCVRDLPGYWTSLSGNPTARNTIGVVVVVLAFLIWVTKIGGTRWSERLGETPPEEETT